MAIIKTIPIHDKRGIKNAINYVADEEKTTVKSNDVTAALDYAENMTKTIFELDGDKDILVSGYNCDRESAPDEFVELKKN